MWWKSKTETVGNTTERLRKLKKSRNWPNFHFQYFSHKVHVIILIADEKKCAKKTKQTHKRKTYKDTQKNVYNHSIDREKRDRAYNKREWEREICDFDSVYLARFLFLVPIFKWLAFIRTLLIHNTNGHRRWIFK